MKDEYVMGIDNGGTVTKAAIYDRKGQVLAIASKSTQMLTPRNSTQSAVSMSCGPRMSK
ncbi:putative L-xylulose kinase [Klebsiella pneumoniae]|uniref:Putative L-xylulose kinase n=1 Tax=Klebsiella pneumoniae TaxID=573 RepID=A0A377TN80_KLEPN|nr:putative L-xylulose kinase [Klebsiella pneumoniae]